MKDASKKSGSTVFDSYSDTDDSTGLFLGDKNPNRSIECPADGCGEPIDFVTSEIAWDRDGQIETTEIVCGACETTVTIIAAYQGREYGFETYVEEN